jgi:hypothetical protein
MRTIIPRYTICSLNISVRGVGGGGGQRHEICKIIVENA